MSSFLEARHIDATLWVGNLDERVTEDLLWELFLQIGRVTKVSILSELTTRYAFIEFEYEEEVEYAMKIMKCIQLYGREMKLNYNRQKEDSNTRGTTLGKNVDVGANLHIGNLGENVTEDDLKHTFSSFGNLIRTPYIPFDDSGAPKGHAFVSFDSFDASDLAIECMHGQYYNNRIITVQYAFKQGNGIKKERHGSLIERRLAKSTVKAQFKQHKIFAESPGETLNLGPKINNTIPNVNASANTSSANPSLYSQQQHPVPSMPPPLPPNNHGGIPYIPPPSVINPIQAYGNQMPTPYAYGHQPHPQQSWYAPPPPPVPSMPYGQIPYNSTNTGYNYQQHHQPPPFPSSGPR